jgi:hypothetical protein
MEPVHTESSLEQFVINALHFLVWALALSQDSLVFDDKTWDMQLDCVTYSIQLADSKPIIDLDSMNTRRRNSISCRKCYRNLIGGGILAQG